MISGTITDLSGRTLSGQTPEAFWNSVRHAEPLIDRPQLRARRRGDARPYRRAIGRVADTLVCAYPNAGLPNEFGQYDESPEYMARADRRVRRRRPRQHRRRLLRHDAGPYRARSPRRSRGTAPRAVPAIEPRAAAVGPRAVRRSRRTIPFVNVGERTNVTGSAKFRKLITAGDYAAALDVAREQVENGAQIIDVNMDEGLLDSEAAMVTFLNLIAAEPDIARVPVMIDSSKCDGDRGRPEVRAGQADRQLDLDEGRRGGVPRTHAKIVRRYGAAVVVMAFDEQGQADTFERKIEICARAYDILTERGRLPARGHHLRSQHLRGRDRASRSTTTTASTSSRRRAGSRQNLPHAHISGGVSNLSFSFRGNEPVREAMHSVFLYHAIQAGMDMGIVNAGQLAVYDDIDPELREACEDVVLNRRAGRDRAAAGSSPSASRGKAQAGQGAATSPGASGRSRSGSRMRWSTASPNSSRRTPRRRG